MLHSSNQQIEKYYFEKFATDFQLPNGEINYGDKPDVIIRGTEKIVGIEIANLYLIDGSNKVSEQVQRKRREKVIELAEADYKSKSNLKYEFHISFNQNSPIINAKFTAMKLVNFIISVEKLSGDFFTNNAFSISPEIHSIYRSPKEYSDAKWQTLQVYEGKDIQPSRVREIVQKKDALISKYIHCDSYWLLLIVDFMDSAQDQEIDWPAGEPPLKCKYEKVIIYKPQFRRHIDVPISPKTTQAK